MIPILYVSNNSDKTVSVITTVTNTVTTTIPVGVGPLGLMVTPDGKEVYIPNSGDGTISVVETATNQVSGTISVGGNPAFVVSFQDPKHAIVLNQGGTGFLQLISTTSHTLVKSNGALGEIFFPGALSINEDGTVLYVLDLANYVATVNAIKPSGGQTGPQFSVTGTLFATTSATVRQQLGNSAVTLNGKYLYVPYLYDFLAQKTTNQVVMINVATGEIAGAPITVGHKASGAAIAPNGKMLYVCNQDDATISAIDITAP